jgi:AcrR family transcriptional regulator
MTRLPGGPLASGDRPASGNPPASGERPLRADARRNRALLLDAAEAVFAAKGTAASTEEVARSAGVGVGTLFRHFPTKESLLEAVYRVRLRRMADAVRDLIAADDPGTALFGFLAEAVSHSATKIAVADALAEAGIDARTASAQEGHDLAEGLEALLVRAQHAGAVRRDVGLPELIALLIGASRAAEHAGTDDVRTRIVAVILDGLRPTSPR